MTAASTDRSEFPEFAWAVGEEGSDPVVVSQGKPFRHDQFAQSGHTERMEGDLADIASLGVRVVRYGVPWRLTEPEPGRYDWRGWDRALRACAEVGLEPVVDLLHFGLPDHTGPFAGTAWVQAFVRYVDAFLARYPEPRWFTPVNEPGITALMTARFGRWNDRLSSAEHHVRVLAHVVLANLEALARVHADRDALWIGSEGFTAAVAMVPEAEEQVRRRRAMEWLVWDLHLGRGPLPEAAGLLDPVDDDVLARIAELAVHDRLIAGHDVYPVSVRAIGGPHPSWSAAERIEIALGELRRWHARYGQPFWIAETSNLSLPISDQVPWLEALTAGLRRLRAEGLPVRGLCWYSRGDQFDWQTALTEPVGAVTEVGLFDTDRRARPVAARFAQLAAGP
jgi:beta-glucosidase/6-phospho-beta-glucosidase/beta-galactosidase